MNDTAYIILNFDFYTLKIKIKSNQTLKFNIADKIKVKSITINKVVYMTHWHENESYWNIIFTYKIKHWFSVLRLYVLIMGLPRRIRIKKLKSCYYAHLNVHQNDRTTNKNGE